MRVAALPVVRLCAVSPTPCRCESGRGRCCCIKRCGADCFAALFVLLMPALVPSSSSSRARHYCGLPVLLACAPALLIAAVYEVDQTGQEGGEVAAAVCWRRRRIYRGYYGAPCGARFDAETQCCGSGGGEPRGEPDLGARRTNTGPRAHVLCATAHSTLPHCLAGDSLPAAVKHELATPLSGRGTALITIMCQAAQAVSGTRGGMGRSQSRWGCVVA